MYPFFCQNKTKFILYVSEGHITDERQNVKNKCLCNKNIGHSQTDLCASKSFDCSMLMFQLPMTCMDIDTISASYVPVILLFIVLYFVYVMKRYT